MKGSGTPWQRHRIRTGLFEPKSLLRENGNFQGRDKEAETDLVQPGRIEIDQTSLRPDRLPGTRPQGAALQKITGGFRDSVFRYSIEEKLRRLMHHEALRRAGLPWPPPHDETRRHPERWWSSDPQQQARNRATYLGLRIIRADQWPPMKNLSSTILPFFTV